MSPKTVVALTDQPEKWSKIQRNEKQLFNIIITRDTHSLETNICNNKTDLVIIAQQDTENAKLYSQAFSNTVDAPFTLLIPPDRIDDFVEYGFSQCASTLLSTPTRPAQRQADLLAGSAPISNVALSTATGTSLCLNGYLLGPFHILINGLLLNDFAGRKTKSLLAYLLYNNHRPNFRETLMEKFWPDVGAESARNSLNVAIHSIRRLFRELIPTRDLLVYKHDKYFINPEIDIKLDHEEFVYKLKKGKRIEASEGIQHAISDYEEAVRLYRGDFLEDSPYEAWSYTEREHIKEGYCYVLDRLSEYYCTSGKYKIAQHYCRRILEKDTCREDIHRRMMKCLHLTGHRDLAVKQFQKCEAALIRELDMLPGNETVQLLEEIKKG